MAFQLIGTGDFSGFAWNGNNSGEGGIAGSALIALMCQNHVKPAIIQAPMYQ